MTVGTPDKELGLRIRHFRRQRDLTQRQLAAQLGISSQQLQKYETGANRLAVSKLVDIAAALNLHISRFLGEDDETLSEKPAVPEVNEVGFTHEALLLVRAFSQIGDATIRSKLLDLVQAMANKT